MKINMQKAKIMRGVSVTEWKFKIDNRTLESVEEYVYLGQILTGEPTHVKEITVK